MFFSSAVPRRLFRPLLPPVNAILVVFNELPEVPLAPALRLSPPFLRPQRTRLVHSVAVSVEQRASPLRSLRRRGHSISRRYRSAAKEFEMPSGKPFERLPETVRPQHYVLSLVPDLKALVFDGDVAVRIEVGPPYAGAGGAATESIARGAAAPARDGLRLGRPWKNTRVSDRRAVVVEPVGVEARMGR
jgi:hypothetical protein